MSGQINRALYEVGDTLDQGNQHIEAAIGNFERAASFMGTVTSLATKLAGHLTELDKELNTVQQGVVATDGQVKGSLSILRSAGFYDGSDLQVMVVSGLDTVRQLMAGYSAATKLAATVAGHTTKLPTLRQIGKASPDSSELAAAIEHAKGIQAKNDLAKINATSYIGRL